MPKLTPQQQATLSQRSQALEDQIKSLSGQPAPDQEAALLSEMLDIRATELVSEGFLKQDAIDIARDEIALDFSEHKTEKEQQQFTLLQETAAALKNKEMKVELTPDEQADRKKKLEEYEQKEKKKDDEKKKKDSTGTSNFLSTVYGVDAKPSYTTPEQAINDAPKDSTIYIHINTHQVRVGWHNGEPNAFGKSDDQTTLDYDGLRLTAYNAGIHGEVRLAISSNATAEQKARFIEAGQKGIAEIEKLAAKGYGLLGNNCQAARTTFSKVVDPSMKVCSMPWNANNEFEKRFKQQNTQKQTNIAINRDVKIAQIQQSSKQNWIKAKGIKMARDFALEKKEQVEKSEKQKLLEQNYKTFMKKSMITPESLKSPFKKDLFAGKIQESVFGIQVSLKDLAQKLENIKNMPADVKDAFKTAANDPKTAEEIHNATISGSDPSPATKDVLNVIGVNASPANQVLISKAITELLTQPKPEPTKGTNKTAALQEKAEAALKRAEERKAREASQPSSDTPKPETTTPQPTAAQANLQKSLAEQAAAVSKLVEEKKAELAEQGIKVEQPVIESVTKVVNTLNETECKSALNEHANECEQIVTSTNEQIKVLSALPVANGSTFDAKGEEKTPTEKLEQELKEKQEEPSAPSPFDEPIPQPGQGN